MAVVSEARLRKKPRVTVVEVENSRAALADLGAAFYRFPGGQSEDRRRHRHERQNDDHVS